MACHPKTHPKDIHADIITSARCFWLIALMDMKWYFLWKCLKLHHSLDSVCLEKPTERVSFAARTSGFHLLCLLCVHYSVWSGCNHSWDCAVNYRVKYHASVPFLLCYAFSACGSITWLMDHTLTGTTSASHLSNAEV